MVKFRGGSRRRSYPQIGQRFIVDKPSLTLRLEVLQRRPTRAGKWTHDHERQDASIPRCNSKLRTEWIETHQVSLWADALQRSVSQRLHHESIREPLILIGSRRSELFSMPHEMSLKSMDVFKWHGAGNVSRIVHQVRTGKSLVPLYSGRSLAAVTHYVAIASRI